MISLGKITDKIGFNENNELIYLGKKSGITQTELDNKNGVYFDTNNINKFVEMNEYTNMRESSESFINDARFYVCNNNISDGLCFRCYKNCQTCVDCQTCFNCANCYGCRACNDCNRCIDCQTCAECYGECHGCNACQGCHSKNNCCYFCNGCAGCYDACANCVNCQEACQTSCQEGCAHQCANGGMS